MNSVSRRGVFTGSRNLRFSGFDRHAFQSVGPRRDDLPVAFHAGKAWVDALSGNRVGQLLEAHPAEQVREGRPVVNHAVPPQVHEPADDQGHGFLFVRKVGGDFRRVSR